MKTRLACLATLLALGSAAHAATPVYLTVDHSTEAVLDNASAQAIWKEGLLLNAENDTLQGTLKRLGVRL